MEKCDRTSPFIPTPHQDSTDSTTLMNVLRRRINPETLVITQRQLAKYLKN